MSDSKNYVCDRCEFVSNNKYHYQRHLLTKKHELLNSVEKNEYTCDCGRIFKHKSSYSRHKNSCRSISTSSDNISNNISNNELLLEQVLKMNQNTLNIMSELQKNNYSKVCKLKTERKTETKAATYYTLCFSNFSQSPRPKQVCQPSSSILNAFCSIARFYVIFHAKRVVFKLRLGLRITRVHLR